MTLNQAKLKARELIELINKMSASTKNLNATEEVLSVAKLSVAISSAPEILQVLLDELEKSRGQIDG